MLYNNLAPWTAIVIRMGSFSSGLIFFWILITNFCRAIQFCTVAIYLVCCLCNLDESCFYRFNKQQALNPFRKRFHTLLLDSFNKDDQ